MLKIVERNNLNLKQGRRKGKSREGQKVRGQNKKKRKEKALERIFFK